MTTSSTLKLSLLENAYDYLNSSLEFVVKAREADSQKAWKFAILHITHCIELLLKERLRHEHQLLIYAKIDKFVPITRETKTVEWNVLVERIRFVLGEEFREVDSGRVQLAQNLRNQMIHYDVELSFPKTCLDYANLLNFVVKFHEKFLEKYVTKPLYLQINVALGGEKDFFSTLFDEELVYFNGLFMGKSQKELILAEQKRTVVKCSGLEYDRIKWGDESKILALDDNYSNNPCHSCGAVKGQYHTLCYCDVELCPKCNGQLFLNACQCLDAENFAGDERETDQTPTMK